MRPISFPDGSDPGTSLALLASALDALPQLVAVADTDGSVLFLNRAWTRHAPGPWDDEEFRAAEAGNLLEALDRAERDGDADAPALRGGLRAVAQGIRSSFEYHLPRAAPDGERWYHIWVGTAASPPARRLVVVTLTDVTGQLRDERERIDSEARLRDLYDESPLGIFSCLPDGTYLSANRAFLRMLGHRSVAELVTRGTPLSEGSTSERLFALEEIPELPLGHGDREVELRRADGTAVTLRIWLRPVLGEDGDLARVEGIAEDVTERRALERRLLESQKLEAIGQLAGGVAHDFNNLLTVILGEAELGLLALEEARDARDSLEEIRRAARSAGLVTRQLLMFARRDLARPQVVDVNDSVRTVHRMLDRLIGDRVEVRIVPSEGPAWARVDTGRLEQVLLNLAVNARDAMPDGGTLTITTRRETEPRPAVQIAVRDTGLGMSEDVKAKAFEPFFTTKAKGEGTGLGLAAVYGIVQDSGGTVDIDTEPGRGTTVSVRLPAVSPDPAASDADGHVRPVPARAHVLLVEDADGARRAARRLLESAGFEVTDVGDASAALAALADRTTEIDLLLTDLVLPGSSGQEVAREARRARPGLPVILMSGYPPGECDESDSVVDPEERVLEKPFALEDLTAAIVGVLSRGPGPSSGGPGKRP